MKSGLRILIRAPEMPFFIPLKWLKRVFLAILGVPKLDNIFLRRFSISTGHFFSNANLGKTSTENEGFNSGIARKWGGGYPCPNFLVLFFHQVIVPKKVIFYPKLTIFVGFSVIFVIIIIKITKILIKIIMATIIIIISIFFRHTRKTSFLSAGKSR